MFVRLFVVLVCPNAHMHAQPEKIKNQMATIAASISLDDDEPKAAASMASRVCIARLFLTVTLFLQRQHQKLRPHCPRRRHQQMPQGSYRPHPRRQKKMRRITKLRPNRRAHIFFFLERTGNGGGKQVTKWRGCFFLSVFAPTLWEHSFSSLFFFFFLPSPFLFSLKKQHQSQVFALHKTFSFSPFFFFLLHRTRQPGAGSCFYFLLLFFFFLHFPPSSYRYTKRKKKTHGKY